MAAVELVNSVDDGANSPADGGASGGSDAELPLQSVGALTEFFARHRYSGRHDADQRELERVRAIIPRLRELLVPDRDRAAEAVNAVLAAETPVLQMRRHGDVDWHLHYVDDARAWDERVLMETAMAMVEVIRADETSRLGACADQTCSAVVLDLSRNRSKRFCSHTCANRNAVAAYRLRNR